MPTNRKLLGAAAFSLALAGGGAAGALLGTPSLSGAQDGTEDTSEITTDAAGPRFGEHRGESLATAAEAIGITEDELRAALQDGQSIAQVAEAEGVDVQVVIDALVADATERLEEAISNLPDRMTEVVNREGFPERRGPGGPGGRHWFHPRLDAAADAIGITEDELRAALEDGDTIADVAAANDVDVQAVIDALVADATAHIDEEVAEGDLTEEQATERKANLEERITALVNGERRERPADAPVADDA
jgi:hypothetical protein